MSVYEQSSHDGIVFFSKIAATFTHDIKNVLAIINENAGLLEDITLMASKGYPLNTEKIMSITSKVQAQIQRADDMVGRMNTFAHSNDNPDGPIDLKNGIELLLAMTKRIQAKKNVSFTVHASDDTFLLHAQPFMVLNFLWFCIEKAAEFCNDSRTIKLEIEKNTDILMVQITGIKQNQMLPMSDAETFMETMGISYSFNRELHNHQFSFPLKPGKEQQYR